MLQMDCKRAFHPDGQRAANAFAPARPERFRDRGLGVHGAHDLAPLRDKLALGKAEPTEGLAADLRKELGNGKRPDAAPGCFPILSRPCHPLGLCQRHAMEGNGGLGLKGDALAQRILPWYDACARDLPWRVPPGASRKPDPYRVWIAEVMLQQTTVAAAAPRYQAFLARFPTVLSLAEASPADLMEAWAGLGYYARARNLASAARQIAEEGFPRTAAALARLPGVGAYTSAAVAAIAFAEPVAVIDANVERVLSRIFACGAPRPKLKDALRPRLEPLVPAARPGDFAQGLMDLGATICTPAAPRCDLCPVADCCSAFITGRVPEFPAAKERKARPVRRGTAWWIERDGKVALVRRPPRGLLGGMLALPGSRWEETDSSPLPFPSDWRFSTEPVRHGFTHFVLELRVAATRVCEEPPLAGPVLWTETGALSGLPTLFAKAATLAQSLRA